MQLELTIRNYRCFADAHPVRLTIEPGLTAIVGINNAGKSALLRFLYEFRPLFRALSSPDSWASLLHPSRALGFTFPNNAVKDVRAVFSNTNARDLRIDLKVRIDANEPIAPPPAPLATSIELTIARGTPNTKGRLREPGVSIREDAPNLRMDGWNLQSPSETLANLSALGTAMKCLANTLYLPAYRNAVNLGVKTDYFDMATGQAFVERWRQMAQGDDREMNRTAERIQEKICALLGFRSLRIQPGLNDSTLKLTIDGEPYDLDEVGAGVAQFILVLVNAATKKPAWILLDEPELSLHPALQIDFLTALATFAQPRGGVLFATHNYGLARATAQRIYSVIRRSDGTSEVHPYDATPNLTELLGSLGYAGYSQLGFETVLLVEGPHDVLLMHQWLRHYGLDHKVLVLPLSGASLINARSGPILREFARITPRLFALIDSERASAEADLPQDRAAFQRVCTEAGIRCHVTERRAVESYLTDAAVKRVMGENYRAIGPFERLGDVLPAWGKADNWRIAQEMEQSDLAATDLDGLLRQLAPSISVS